jgi:predicted unusual protein kinase regulating ubiquinone biosynthesis (AarF/ABC1/UbiB family)
MVKPNQPNSRIGRGYRVGRLGLSLAGSYLGYQLQNLLLGSDSREERRRTLHRRVSRRVREELESLKGPFMKLGQLLSTQSQALPDDVLEELAKLQMKAPGMHPTLARAQFKASFGKYPEEAFTEFDPEPFAAASLGQVHCAVTKQGARVAVKIQYPAIRTAIENDFKLLKSAAIPGRVTGYFPVAILEEAQRGFLEETDYLNEGRNIDFLREQLARFQFLTIPNVHWDLTTDRVLTMSFLQGTTIRDFLARKPSQAVRNLIGFRLLQIYQYQLHFVHAIHADPHPGNYLFQDDGSIGLVDFGCVKRLSPDIPELARALLERAWLQGDRQVSRILRLIWGPGDYAKNPKAHRMLETITDFYNTVFPPPESNCPVVDFGSPRVLNSLTLNMQKAVRHKLANAEFAFSTRAELGLYNLLHQLAAKVDTADVLQTLDLFGDSKHPDATTPATARSKQRPAPV